MKNKFIYSTLILIIGGCITKILGMIIKIVIARCVGSDVLGTYMLLLPTFLLLINLGQFGFPIALAKLISEGNRDNKKLIFSLIPILLFINILLMILIIIFAPFISNNLLHNPDTYISILAISTVIPFTTISGICRSYFFGKNKMIPHVISHIIEDIVRLIIIIKVTPLVIPYGIKYTTCFLILINILSEIISTLVLVFFIPRNTKIKKIDLVPNKIYIKDSLKISIPNTLSRLVGSIGYFLEPIILTNILLYVGYNIKFITEEYGIITGFIVPLVFLPSFFALAISDALLPIISKEYLNKNIKVVKDRLLLAIVITFIIGLLYTIVLFCFPRFLLFFIYHTTKGIKYLKVLVFFSLIQYIQYPLTSCLDAMGKSKDNLSITIISTVVRICLLIVLSFLKIGLWSLIFTMNINIIITSLLQIKKVRKYLTF